jgi:hypothetical protein
MIRTLVLSLRSALAALLLSLLILPSLSGCAIFAQAMAAIPTTEQAKYKNLSDQSVAVMVWAEDTGVQIEWPKIRLDLATMIQSRLQKRKADDKPEELKLTRFPVSPGSVVRFQEEHPELVAESCEKIAPMLGVSRLIYVEIRSFQTRSDISNDLFRGAMTGSVSVIEVTNGKGRIAYTDDNLRVFFPRMVPDEGLPNLGDFPVYTGNLNGFAEEVCKRLVSHLNDPDVDYGTSLGTVPSVGQ